MNTVPQVGTYAVLFRAHFWDDYVERQYQRLLSRCNGDLFITVDVTNGPVAVPHPNVVTHSRASILGLGLSGAGHGNVLWFNGDYPLYAFYAERPDYDHYVMVEYDVVIQIAIGDMVSRMRREGIDFVGLTKGESVSEWPHTESCLDAYAPEQVRKSLICLTAFSRRALGHLFEKRLTLSRLHREGALRRWPYCEAFVPTELGAAGFKSAELSEFGSTDRYDWWPPTHEDQLEGLSAQAFLHPVLEGGLYIRSVLHHEPNLLNFFRTGSQLRTSLARFPREAYRPYVYREFRRRLIAATRRRLERRGLMRQAEVGAERKA